MLHLKINHFPFIIIVKRVCKKNIMTNNCIIVTMSKITLYGKSVFVYQHPSRHKCFYASPSLLQLKYKDTVPACITARFGYTQLIPNNYINLKFQHPSTLSLYSINHIINNHQVIFTNPHDRTIFKHFSLWNQEHLCFS